MKWRRGWTRGRRKKQMRGVDGAVEREVDVELGFLGFGFQTGGLRRCRGGPRDGGGSGPFASDGDGHLPELEEDGQGKNAGLVEFSAVVVGAPAAAQILHGNGLLGDLDAGVAA